MDFLANSITFILDAIKYVTSMPPEVWQAIGAMVGVTVLLQKLKKWLAIQSRTLITFVLAVLSFIPVVIDYINAHIATNPSVLAPRTILIMGGATTIYNTIGRWVIGVLTDAKALREQRDAQVTPAASVPTTPASETSVYFEG